MNIVFSGVEGCEFGHIFPVKSGGNDCHRRAASPSRRSVFLGVTSVFDVEKSVVREVPYAVFHAGFM